MNDKLFSVENKICIVTGGLGQIGKNFVQELWERGAKVAVWGRTVNDERILGFFWDAADGVAFMNAAGKAYLALPAEMAAKGYRLDGSEVTGIGQIATDVQGEGQVYSISGVRMDGSKRLPAGIYIINGRKVIVK